MGKKLDALLGRSFKASKFKALLNIAISRLAVLKNQRQSRSSLARSDAVQLLRQGHQDRALLRVEHVIKENNMLNVLDMIEGHCVLLTERVKIIEIESGCPDELKEAISSLIFAASRCGDFPELQEIRKVFTSRYGKEFVARAVELRNSCGINPKMIQMLSTRQPDLEVKTKVLKEIADENGIDLKLEEPPSIIIEEKPNKGMENQLVQNRTSSDNAEFGNEMKNFDESLDGVEGFHNSMNRQKNYKDVADAAQEAFLSAAYAAAAARAAVELSKSSPRSPGDPNDQTKQVFYPNDTNSGPGISEGKYFEENNDPVLGFDKFHPLDKFGTKSNDEEIEDETISSRITNIKQVGSRRDSPLISRILQKDNDSDKRNEGKKHTSVVDEAIEGERETELPYFSRNQTSSSFGTDSRTDYKPLSPVGRAVKNPQMLNANNRPVSLRTRR